MSINDDLFDKLYSKTTKQAFKKKNAKRRKEPYEDEVIYKARSPRRKKPDTFQSNVEYDFLQYARLVFRWGRKNTGLSTPNIELLLYLYPIGLFNKREFFLYCKCVTLYPQKIYKDLLKDGWIKEWRKPRNGNVSLYSLTDKAIKICDKMHRMCNGDIDIPENKSNEMVNSKQMKDSLYMDVIKHHNEQRRTKKDRQ